MPYYNEIYHILLLPFLLVLDLFLDLRLTLENNNTILIASNPNRRIKKLTMNIPKHGQLQ